MTNYFNNCTFNNNNTTNVYIENLNINININNNQRESKSDTSASIALIGLIGIGAFFYPASLPILIAKATTIIETGLILGATTSSLLTVKEIIKSYKKTKKGYVLLENNTENSKVNYIESEKQPILEYDLNGNLLESNLSINKIDTINNVFKNRTKEQIL